MNRPLLAAVAFLLLGFARPAQASADRYTLDKPHTQILFSISHLGFSQSYGKFLDYSGFFMLDYAHPETASVEAVIHTSSVDMGDSAWDKAVLNFFHPDKYPDMTFKSTVVHLLSKTTADVDGNLTLLGVTKPVTLHVTLNKDGRNPMGTFVCGFSAQADIKRSDFGMNDYLPLLGDKVHITIEAEGNRVDPPGKQQYNQ